MSDDQLTKEQLLSELNALRQRVTQLELADSDHQEEFKKSSIWLENSPVCTKILDLDFNLQYMSSSGVKELQIDDINEYYGHPYPFHFYPDSFKVPMKKNLRAAKSSGKTIIQVASVVDIEGNELWYHSTIVLVQDSAGNPDYIMVVSFDITAQKQAEEELSLVSSILEETEKISNVAGWRWDLIAQKMFWTDETYQIHEIDPADIEPGAEEHIENSISCYDEKDRPIVEEAFQKCAQDGIAYALEVPFTTFKGKRLWIRTVAHAEKENGKVVRVIGNIMDITKRKQAEAELIAAKERFENIIKQSPIPMVITALNGDIEYFNDKFTELFGYTLNDVRTAEQWWAAAYPKEDYRVIVQQAWERAIATALEHKTQIETLEWNLTCKDRSIRRVEFDMMPLGDISVIVMNDITERKLAEEALQESENKFKSLFENKGTATGIFGEDSIVIDCNAMLADLVGYSKHEILDKMKWSDLVVKEDLIRLQKYHSQRLKSGDPPPSQYECSIIKKSGEFVNVIVNLALIGEKRIVSLTNITERKQAETALKDSEKLLRVIAKNLPDSYLSIIEKDFTIGFTSGGEFTKRGLDPDDFMGLHIKQIFGEHEPEVKKYFEETFLGNEQKFELFNDNEYQAYQTIPLYDKGGNISRILSVAQNVTERKLADEALRQSEERMKTLSEASFEAIFLSEKGICLDQNGTAEVMFGFTHAEAVGRPGIEWIVPEDHDLVKKNMHLGREQPYEVTALRKDGTTFPCEIQGRMTLYQTRPLRITSLRDITKRKQTEKERLSLETQLHQAQKLEAVGTMLGGISHEFNNILQSIFLYGGLVQEELPDKKSLQANMRHLLQDGERARDIVKQILTFSRKSKVDVKPHILHELVSEALMLEQASLPANITLKQDVELSPSLVECDKTQIHQIVLNLCNNAQHAMEATGGILAVSLHQIQASLNSGNSITNILELKVRDTGHGIDPADLERIFDPLFTTKQVGQGTGLGLSVIHGIVEMMGGDISVTSEVAKGTTFSILFPVVEDVEDIHPTPKAIASKDDFKMSILLVDDDTSIREVTQAILNRKGFAVESASDGQKAFDLFKANPDKYNLIVTDLSMPNMSGIELCQAIRASGSDIPIMLSTGHLDIEDQKEYENIGITKSIQKPWTADELIERIHKTDKR